MTISTTTLTTTAPDGTALHSYVAMPIDTPTNSTSPAVLVAPEWWGVVEHPKTVAERLANEGFVAVVMDIYGDGKMTTDAHQANEWMTQMLTNSDELMNRCAKIFADVAALPQVDGSRIGIAGFCFGGKIALDMARLGTPLKAVATFHGNPTPITPATADKFTAKVLVAHGGADSMIPDAAIDGLRAELDAANVSYEIDVYAGAKHGFSNPHADERARENSVDLGYHADAAKASWDKMVKFMKESL
ncbi:dienelactone hydrolase family protein [Moraxella sp. FZLJ2107]|uniref:dienelactone hydrolase family protein n=1 Tax=unclassified Moraxella TaxID=2685852 RepID=UPI0020C85CFC|nr:MULTISPECIES: dienelactone hydrolase family protein [unclassified Moraxella]UTO04156.1 dienelactone hydrolase family protein [Moraxella sp. FZLJ2107]UTO22989.1 dienelactone hydrolase family protein [Moraxella sp. FZLJ2109]